MLAAPDILLAPLQIITPFTMYFNARLIFQKYELWRLLTNFLFFGNLGALWSPGSQMFRVPAELSYVP